MPNPGSRARSWPKRACELQIPVDGTARIDRRWLAEQYLVRHRSYTDIAAQLGVTDMTVIAAARRHHIPSRPVRRPQLTGDELGTRRARPT